MKSILFFRNVVLASAILMSGSNICAQEQPTEYYPIGTTWEEVFALPSYFENPSTSDPNSFNRYEFYVERDTIVNDKTFKIVVRTLTECYRKPSMVGSTLRYYIFEQGDSVFSSAVIPSGNDNGKLFYVFKKPENNGDITWCENQYDVQNLDCNQELLLDGNVYDVYSTNKNQLYWTIGQVLNGLTMIFSNRSGTSRLTKFSRNNVLIYENDIPSPQADAIYEVQPEMEQQNRYTLHGIMVDGENLKSGVYIQKGKKHLVK